MISAFLEPKLLDQRGDIIAHELKAERPVDVGGAAVRIDCAAAARLAARGCLPAQFCH